MMVNLPNWLSDFQITPDQAQQWQSELPKGKSFVRWCIESRKVVPEAFLIWAKKAYQLPLLKENFSEFAQAQELAKRYSNIWPDHVAPLADWDGTLFLACLEPVPDFHPPQKHQWVLAPLGVIQKIRGEEDLHEAVTQTSSSESGPVLDVPAGLNIDMPAGLSLDFGSLSLESNAADHSGPAGLNLASPPPPIPVVPPPVPVAVPPVPVVPPPIARPTLTVVPPPIPAAHQPPPPPAEAAPTRPSPPSPSVSMDDVSQTVLKDMSELFERSMILIFQGENLEPWKWNGGWKLDASRTKTIDLSSASVFRIVRDSKNSYHGRVVPNAINDAFFQTWTVGITPEHLTIVPILMGDLLGGMLLGTCTKKRGESISLRGVEALGEKTAELLIKNRTQSKAA